jgi:DHA1 family bicyclomycin/chloramphenicol resistance-like MFS transporter
MGRAGGRMVGLTLGRISGSFAESSLILISTAQPAPADHGLRFPEFVLLAAGVMTIGAMAIDAMLPALPAIGRSLAISDANDRQWIITAYLVGNGVGQSFYGLLADRYGRRPVLLLGVFAYAVFGTLAAFASSFTVLLLLRVLHGLAAASTVIVRSIVRDCYAGARLAQVSSLTFVVFLAVPVLAPSIGQAILAVADWRAIFGFFGLFGLVIFFWAALRLPETLDPAWRRAIHPSIIAEAVRHVIGNRLSCCYTLALTCLFGTLLGYVGSIQQIFGDVFHRPDLLAGMFATCAGTMGVLAFLNSRIVHRVGVRRVAHTALVVFIVTALIHSAVAAAGYETMVTFVIFQAMTIGCFGLVGANFGALAMEQVAAVAGMAASIQGVVSTLGGALLGAIIGQCFNGTTLPLALGAAIGGLGALAAVLIAEHGRLSLLRQA